MKRSFTRNHVEIIEDALRVAVGPAHALLEAIGIRATVYLDPIGAEIDAGAPFGRVEGDHQACHLYAPFALRIIAHDGHFISVEMRSPPIEDLLDDHDYREHWRHAPR